MGRHAARGFTLMELLIVIGILALGAFFLTPQLARAGQAKTAEILQIRVQESRRAIELYLTDHAEAPGFIERGWADLLGGRYLGAEPENPLIPVESCRAKIVPGFSGSASAGWHWEPTTGSFGASYFNEGTGQIDLTRP